MVISYLSFKKIDQYVPIRDMIQMYDPYHEMDIRQFCDKMNEIILQNKEGVISLAKALFCDPQDLLEI